MAGGGVAGLILVVADAFHVVRQELVTGIHGLGHDEERAAGGDVGRELLAEIGDVLQPGQGGTGDDEHLYLATTEGVNSDGDTKSVASAKLASRSRISRA